MTRLLEATFARDFDTARTLLSDDAEFHLPGDRRFIGADAVIAAFEGIVRPELDIESTVLNQLSDGRVVMNQRVERFTSERGSLELRIAGVFELRDGLVRRWTDYNDR